MITDVEVLKTAALVLVPALLAVVAWFMRQSVLKQDRTTEQILRITKHLEIDTIRLQKDVDNLNRFVDSIATVTSDWAIIKHEVKEISKELKDLNEIIDDVTLLKANQKYIFENIAEIRKELEGA